MSSVGETVSAILSGIGSGMDLVEEIEKNIEENIFFCLVNKESDEKNGKIKKERENRLRIKLNILNIMSYSPFIIHYI